MRFMVLSLTQTNGTVIQLCCKSSLNLKPLRCMTLQGIAATLLLLELTIHRFTGALRSDIFVQMDAAKYTHNRTTTWIWL